METLELHQRIIENKDWVTILIVTTLALIAVTKTTFENRFSEFIKLIYTTKYLKIYKNSSNFMDWFTFILFIIQIISFTLFIQLLFNYFGFTTKTNIITFIQITTLLSFFIISKFLVEKIIATSLNVEELNEELNMQRVSYRNYIGLFLFPINIIFFYNSPPPSIIILLIIVIILLIFILSYLISLKIYQKFIISKLFYFILYICTLEIIPYYFIYYWFTKILVH